MEMIVRVFTLLGAIVRETFAATGAVGVSVWAGMLGIRRNVFPATIMTDIACDVVFKAKPWEKCVHMIRNGFISPAFVFSKPSYFAYNSLGHSRPCISRRMVLIRGNMFPGTAM